MPVFSRWTPPALHTLARRHAAVLTLWVALASWLAPALPAAHPDLFFNAADVATLRAKALASIPPPDNPSARTPFTNPYQEILIDCRSSYGPGDAIPNSSRKRNAQALVSHGALLLLEPTGRAIEDRYQSNTRFFQYFDTVLNWPEWDTFFGGTPLDTSLFLTAICTGYDWHYDRFTSTQRADIVSKLSARADYIVAHKADMLETPADLDNPSSFYLHTFKVLRNRSVIPAAALATVAYTLEGEVNEAKRQTWLITANAFLTEWEERVSWDGVSHEGYSYHEYLNQTLYPLLHVKARRTGVNDFKRIPYVNMHPLYSIYSWVPGGDRSFVQPVPFGDCETGPPADMRTMAQLSAKMLKGDAWGLDRLAQWMAACPNDIPNNAYSRVDPMQFFWVDDTITTTSPAAMLAPYRYFPNRGMFIWRTGWDHMATYFGMVCGPTIGGHQLPEQGNFVIYKGGSPYVAHHMKTQARNPGEYNLLTIANQGQIGELYENGTTKPAAPSDWASITKIIEDTQYFNIVCNLQPIYIVNPQEFTREFALVGGYFLVRDKVRTSSSSAYKHYTQAYSTLAPTVGIDESWSLELDSNPNVNPFAGSGRNYTITPRSAGPFTGSMTVRDLSRTAWSSAVQNATADGVRRGSELVRSLTSTAASSLMCYGFAEPTDVIYDWTDGPTEGMVLQRNGSLKALIGWSDGTGFNNGGFLLQGKMGGMDAPLGLVFGRDATRIEYYGTLLAEAATAATFFANTLGGNGGQLKLICPAGGQIRLRCPGGVTSLKLNGMTLASGWSWAGDLLTIQAPASTSMQIYDVIKMQNAAQSDWVSYQ